MSELTRIGVLRGGPSNEYEVSIASGASVLKALRDHHEHKYRAKDIFIDRKGNWHVDGIAMAPEDAINHADIIFNALHGAYGEDGKVQTFLEAHGKPFTGSDSLASSVGMNKALSKKIFKSQGIKTPHYKKFHSKDLGAGPDGAEKIVAELFQTFLLPAVVKPVSSGSSVGVTLVKSYDRLADALREAAIHDDSVMIEEFIPGIEATCAVVEGFRGEELYALPPVEIRPGNEFYDYDAKYSGKSQKVVPSTFSDKVKRAIEDLAKKIHKAVGLRHYSRSDFIIHPRRGIYVLEVNTLPGLTEESSLPKALRAVGSDVHEFVEHVIEHALNN